jgi:hypothetical protein
MIALSEDPYRPTLIISNLKRKGEQSKSSAHLSFLDQFCDGQLSVQENGLDSLPSLVAVPILVTTICPGMKLHIALPFTMIVVNLPALLGSAFLNFSFVKSRLFKPFESVTFAPFSILLPVMLKVKPPASVRFNWQKLKGEPKETLPF